ncbi:MAG: SBBP repeat-containing protein [Bacteroidota bacterium]|nr:SBBP repeat-containing protein [Bacteroidota bacterium]
MKEERPFCYQPPDLSSPYASGMPTVPSSFRVDGREIHFDVGTYDGRFPLVIDPTVHWSTYYGGSNGDRITSVTTDAGGNVIVCGFTYSTNLPVTAGAVQSINAGSLDAFVVKFNSSGTRLWATYYGGTGNDAATSVAVAGNGNIIVAGETNSTSFPTTAGAFQEQNGGMYDGFLLCFDALGSLQWATYLGGGADDNAYAVATDRSGNILVTGVTTSANFPVTPGAYQTVIAGVGDAFVAKFSGTGTQIWTTYYGGMMGDVARAVGCDSSGNVYFAGNTNSTNFPVSVGCLQNTQAGQGDAFLVKLASDGTRLWATYYGGSAFDIAHGLAVDKFQRPVMVGRTESANFPVANAFRPYLMSGQEAFLCVFSPTGAREWATFYGGNQDEYASGVSTDFHGNIAFTGQTASTNFPVTQDAIQPSKNGSTDAFIVKFNPQGGRIWSTFFGGNGDDAANAIMAQYSGNVVFGGWTSSTDFPVLSAVQNVNGGTVDGFITKICDVKPLITASGPTNLCPGGRVVLDAGPGYTSYLWSTLETTRTITVDTTGSYAVRVTDGIGCHGVSDTVRVNVASPLFADAGRDTAICRGSGVRIGGQAVGGARPLRYIWRPNTTLDDSTSATPLAFPAVTTTYHLTITDAYNCTATDSVTVFVFALPILHAGPDTMICRGGSVAIGHSASGGTPPYTYAWNPPSGLSSTTDSVTIASPPVSTRYTVTVTDANGCSTVDSVLVMVNRVIADAGTDRVLCAGDTVRLGGGGNFGIGPLQYTWSPAIGLSQTNVARPLAFPLSTTKYTLVVRDSQGCSDTDQVNVSVYTSFTALAGPDIHLCKGSSDVIGDTAVCGIPPYSFRWFPATGLSDTTAMRPTASPTTTCTYVLTVTDAASNTVSDTVVVYVENTPVVSAGVDSLICSGDSVQIGSVATGGTPPYTYFWTPAQGLSDPLIARPYAKPQVTTTYTVVARDAYGCSGIDSVTISIVDFTVHAGDDRSICLGDSIQLSATVGSNQAGPFTYLWQPSTGLTDPTIMNPKASPQSTTVYVLTVKNLKGCTASDTITVVVNQPPVAEAGTDQIVCRNELTQIGDTATGGKPPYKYEWTPLKYFVGSNRVARPLVRPLEPTRYYVTVTDANGCKSVDSVFIALLPWPRLKDTRDISICRGDSVQIGSNATGGTPPYTYKWSPVGGLSDSTAPRTWARPFFPTTYTLTVTDANGCVETDDVRVDVIAPPMPIIRASGPLTFCEYDSVVLSIDSARLYSGYLWYRDTIAIDTSQSIVVREPGLYKVHVNTLQGCRGESPAVRVVVMPLPRAHVNVSGPLTFCAGGSVTFEADSSYGDSFLWSNGMGGRRITVTKPGTYFVTVTGYNGCRKTSPSYTVTVYPLPQPRITAKGPVSFCEGDSIVLDADKYGLYGGYLWSTGATSRFITVKSPGDYTVTVMDDNGCSATSPPIHITVNSIPTPRITASGPLRFCEGNEVTLDAGGGYARYLWSNGANTRTIKVNQGGSYYVAVWTDSGCVGRSNPVTVTVNPLPMPHITPLGPTEFCQGDSVRLDAGGGYSSYQWSNGRTTRVITVKSAGNYLVTVRDANGCQGTSAPVSVTVYSKPQPVISASGPTSFCPGDSVVLDAGAGYATYLWSTGAITRKITVKTSGTYSVTVTNANGCIGTSTPITVTRHSTPVPQIKAGGPLNFCDGGSVELDAGSGYQSYLWSTGARTRRITVSQSGLYNVRVTNQYGCVGESDVVEVRVKPTPPTPVITQIGNTLISTPAYRYQWYFSSAPITGATQRTHNPTRNGQYSVAVWNEDSCFSMSAPFEFRATSIENNLGIESFSVYPDPNEGLFTVEIQLPFPSKVRLIVSDLLGRSVHESQEERVQGPYIKQIGIGDVPGGFYIIYLYVGERVLARPIIKR